jgi:hypothetical protein
MIFLWSCGRHTTNEKSNDNSVIEIDLFSKPASSVKALSDFANNIEYIPLETTKNSLIGPIIRKTLYINNRIYILNSGFDGKILCFDIDGKFLFKINNKGRGPEEYDFVTDFDVSSDNRNLTILSSSARKFLTYGITDTGFNFQRSIKLKDPTPWRFSLVPGTDKAFMAIPSWTGTEPTLSLLISTFGDTLNFKPNHFKYNKIQEGQGGSRSISDLLVYRYGNLVCFKEEFSDTVFYVDQKDNSFKPRILFNTHNTYFNLDMKSGAKKIIDNTTTYIPNIFETSRYIFYWYYTMIVEQKVINLYGFLFDKKTGTKYAFDVGEDRKIKLRDDLSGGPDFNIELFNNQCSGGKLFAFVEAISFKKYVNGQDFINSKVSDPKKKIELKRLADTLEETDNPVLIIVTPKD